MDYKAQEILLNKYRIEALIGQGTFGKVYLVTHLELNVLRALKILRRGAPGISSFEFDNFSRRFHLEAQLGAQLNARRAHPNLLQVYDFHNQNELLALEMEYAPGGSLADRLAHARATGQALSISEIIQILLDTAQGLAAIHSLDVVHRDLKPSNILLAYNRAKVADLGIAQAPGGASLRSTAHHGRLIPHPGTPGYMSPEQEHSGGYLKPPSDIYALGLVTFEMLAGRSYSTLRPGTYVRHLRPDMPTWLGELLSSMLAEAPDRRPWDGSELTGILLANMRRSADANPPFPHIDRQTVPVTPEAAPVARPEADGNLPLPGTGNPDLPPQSDGRASTLSRVTRKPVILVGGGFATLSVLALTVVLLQLGLIALPKRPSSAAGPIVSATFQAGLSPIEAPTLATATQLVSLLPTPTASSILPARPQPLATAARDAALPPLYPEPGELWVSPQDGAKMAYIPAGAFTMGATDLQAGAFSLERPPHPVTLDAYWIAQTEVTNAQYARCVKAGRCQPPLTSESFTRKSYYGNLDYDNYPVVFVSWDDAHAYCSWVGGRLPSEAEWEKAARGDDSRTYPWGEKLDCAHANYWEYERQDRRTGSHTLKHLGCQKDTVAVGSYPSGASPFGILDMVGNVAEWVADWYGKYSSSAQVNPAGPLDGSYRVLRGHFGFYEEKVRSEGGPERSITGGDDHNTVYFYMKSPPVARVNGTKTVSGKGNLISGYTFYFVLRSTFRLYARPNFVDYNVGFRCVAPAAR